MLFKLMLCLEMLLFQWKQSIWNIGGRYLFYIALLLYWILEQKWGGFNKLLMRLSGLNGINYSRYPTSIWSKLTKIFQIYELKFGEVCLSAQQHKSAGTAGKATEAWDDIYGDDILMPSQSTRTTPTSELSIVAIFELSSHLDSDIVTQFDYDFNLLNWWQRHKLTYHVLSILAKDVLTVSASTVSS